MREAVHVALTGEKGNVYKLLLENRMERDHLEDLGLDGKIILEWILGKICGKAWIECVWLRIGASAGLL
jgi:hypothetical protein